MTRSHFSNPHGLTVDSRYSCARDLALLARAASRSPLIAEICVKRSCVMTSPGHPVRRFTNGNRLLKMFPHVTGLKTGYTRGAGRCLVATAASEGRPVIIVPLGGEDPDIWHDASELFTRLAKGYGDIPMGWKFFTVLGLHAGFRHGALDRGAFPG